MSRTVTDAKTVKKEYREFRRLLTICMDGYTQKEYADMIGISGAHLNRMVNQPVIGRPTVKILQAMLTHLPSEVNPYDLFESCGYTASVARFAWRQVRMHETMAERMSKNAQDLTYVVDALKKQMCVFPRIEDILSPFCNHFGLNYQKLRFFEDLAQDGGENHLGQIGIPCRITWSVPYNTEFIYEIWQYVIFYFINVEHGYLLADVATDGASLDAYQVLTEEEKHELRAEDVPLSQLPFVAHGYLRKRSYYVTMQSYTNPFTMDENGNPILTPMKNLIWGRGSFITELPSHFHDYMKANREFFQDTEEERIIMENLEKLKVPAKADEIHRIVNGYEYRNARGYAACLLVVLVRKAKQNGYKFQIEYGCSEDEDVYLKPCLFVAENWYLSRNEVDEDALHEIDIFLSNEFTNLMLSTYGTVLVSHTEFLDLRESSFWQAPLSYEYYGWDMYKKEKEAWLKSQGKDVTHPHVFEYTL